MFSRIRMISLVATLAWVGVLFYLASMSRLPQAPLVDARDTAQLGHFGTHLVLAALVYLTVSPRQANLRGGLRSAIIAVGFSLVLGLVLEGIQLFLPDRSAEAADLNV